MDDENLDETVFLTRFRSPSFTKEEVMLILNLIEKYKDALLNKLTSSFASRTKEITWMKITKEFNKLNPRHIRTMESIKMKWENLKRDVRKLSNNLLDINIDQLDEVKSRVVSMMCEAENRTEAAKLNIDLKLNDFEEQDEIVTNVAENETSATHEEIYSNNSSSYDDDESDMTRSQRSPGFRRDEIILLISLIEQNLNIILDKSTKTTINVAKEKTWMQIAEMFNKQNKQNRIQRTGNQLKTKWENLKKMVKKCRKGSKYDQHEWDSILDKVIEIISLSENKNKEFDPNESNCEFNELDVLNGLDNTTNGHSFEDNISDDYNIANNATIRDRKSKFYDTSRKFSPHECKLLMQCVKQEKKSMAVPNSKSNKFKSLAWIRITKSYNRLSPQKRSTKMLRSKFNNLTRLARKISFKGPIVDMYKNRGGGNGDDGREYIVKREPSEKDYSDLDEICDDDNDAIPHNDDHNSVNATDFIQDPLMTVLNTDSGIDVTQTEDKEVTKLKIELLSYKKETAKLERRRIENAMESDALEASLRLRAARLEAVAAATKLPRSHPALGFTPEEARAEEYLLRYQNT
ncbi:protein PFC0760c [Bombyx mandarina]|uniref:Regulatory protein zeste n=1 Tax=Bombyx mandarina TaxID=7092 RepID=A0A6J2JJH3_BOMMA|nr:protein PFC0760c [Bombyx mandarina]XP_028029427.1 protein PFC0760c [Bombyx mandarina]XP_028029428.1 protein PFC0760c [Bombyx mandarina]